MFATHFYEDLILRTFRGVTMSGYNNLFLALYRSNPTNTGLAGSEILYEGYQRQPITFSAPTIEDTPSSSGTPNVSVINERELLFPIIASDSDNVTHVGIVTSQTVGAGSMLLYGEFAEPRRMLANTQPKIAAGSLRYTLEGNWSNWFKMQVLNTLRGQSVQGFTPFAALYSGNPQSGGFELSGAGYARRAIEYSLPAVQIGGYTSIANNAAVAFEEAGDNWGNWSHSAVMTGETGSNVITIYEMPRPYDIIREDQPVFNPNSVIERLN